MNQKNIFYFLSLLAVFFIGHFYSQFNTKPQVPEIITINNSIDIEQYKADIFFLQLQLDELDNQLITSLDELQATKQKLILSSSKVQVQDDELSSIRRIFKLNKAEIKESNTRLLESENTIRILRDKLSDVELDLELATFELELAKEHLQVQ